MVNSPKARAQSNIDGRRPWSPSQLTKRIEYFDANRRPSIKENWISSTPNFALSVSSRALNPRRSSSGAPTPGRHIPRRKSFNFDQAFYKLKPRPSSSDSEESYQINDDDVFGESDDDLPEKPIKEFGNVAKIRRRLACLSEGSSEHRIFSFQAPKVPSTKQRLNVSEKYLIQPEMTYRRVHRIFPKRADRILDLPNYEDNFFTNTVAWWTESKIITALSKCFFICDAMGAGAENVGKLENEERYSSVAVNLVRNHLALGTSTGQLELWDLETKKRISRVKHTHEDVENLVWAVNECRMGSIDWRPEESDILVSGCRNGQIDIWDTRTFEKAVETREFAHTQGTICQVKHNTTGKLLASGDSGNMLKIWDVNNMKEAIFDKIAHKSSVRAMAWHPTEPYVIMTGGGVDDGVIKLWNITRYKEPILERPLNCQICSLVFSPLTNEIYSGQFFRGNYSLHGNRVLIWKYPEMKKIGNLVAHSGRVLHLQLSPNHTQLASAGGDECLRIWPIAKKRRDSTVQRRSSLALGSIR